MKENKDVALSRQIRSTLEESFLRYSQSTIQFEDSGETKNFYDTRVFNWSGKINIWFDPIFAKLKIFSAFLHFIISILEHRHLSAFINSRKHCKYKYSIDSHLMLHPIVSPLLIIAFHFSLFPLFMSHLFPGSQRSIRRCLLLGWW